MAVNANLRGDLAARLRPINAFYADLVLAPETRFSPIPAAFLRQSFIVLVEKMAPSRPVQLYVGAGPTGEAFVLNAQPAEFARLMAADGARITDEATATEVARTMLVCTRPQNRRFKLVESASELPWRPNLEGEEAATHARMSVELQSVVRPPIAVARIDGGFDVHFHVVSQMNLDELTATVTQAGAVTVESRTVAANLPFTYTL